MRKWEQEKVIMELIDSYSLGPVKSFYPSAISNIIPLPFSDIFKILLSAVEKEILCLKWEVRCPDCGKILEEVYNKQIQIEPIDYDCNFCGDVEVQKRDVYPVFYIADDYRESIRGNIDSDKKKHAKLVHKKRLKMKQREALSIVCSN